MLQDGATAARICDLRSAGLRDAVPLAAALSIPLTAKSGAPLPQRDLILVLTTAVIVISLIVQGLTLEPLAGSPASPGRTRPATRKPLPGCGWPMPA